MNRPITRHDGSKYRTYDDAVRLHFSSATAAVAAFVVSVVSDVVVIAVVVFPALRHSSCFVLAGRDLVHTVLCSIAKHDKREAACEETSHRSILLISS